MGAARHTSAPEPQSLCSDDSKQPDDITLFSWKHGMQLVWDVTCPDTFAPSYLHLTSKGAGKAAEKAEKEKIQKYQELSNKYIVMPVAVETMGAWGHSSLKFIQDIGERTTMASGDKQATFKLLQNISMERSQKRNIPREKTKYLTAWSPDHCSNGWVYGSQSGWNRDHDKQ